MILKNGKRIDGCSDTVPIGTLNPFLGSTAPYGYLLCRGQKVSKTTYKELYEICGDTFGQSTDTEFYLPDLRGQTIAGYKEGDTTFGTLGGLIGSLTHLHSTGNHTLTLNEMPRHSHKDGTNPNEGIYAPSGSTSAIVYYNASSSSSRSTTETGDSQPHNHGDTSSASSVQPTIVLNWIVKAFQLMPNQSYVSTINQESDTNTYSCNYINKLNNYSTNEQIIGTWIDGKPIYRKVVDLGSLPNSTNKYVNHNINIDTPIRCSGICYNSTASMIFTLPMGNINIWLDVNQICVLTTTDRTNTTAKAIIEYTKTTD